MNRTEEDIIINRMETMRWINQEINICLEQLKQQQRYQKVGTEGYVLALKKVQARLDGVR